MINSFNRFKRINIEWNEVNKKRYSVEIDKGTRIWVLKGSRKGNLDLRERELKDRKKECGNWTLKIWTEICLKINSSISRRIAFWRKIMVWLSIKKNLRFLNGWQEKGDGRWVSDLSIIRKWIISRSYFFKNSRYSSTVNRQ